MRFVDVVLFASASAFSGSGLQAEFVAWTKKHAKHYASVKAELAASAAFIANDAIIEEHNAKKLSYTLGHNEFSDLTWEQFRATHLGALSQPIASPIRTSAALHFQLAPRWLMPLTG